MWNLNFKKRCESRKRIFGKRKRERGGKTRECLSGRKVNMIKVCYIHVGKCHHELVI